MRKRSWRRLAGCIAIDLALIDLGMMGALSAADYKAAIASEGMARALALEDSHGTRAVFAQAEFRITQSLADLVAVQVLKKYEIDRAGILLRWSAIGDRPAQPEDLVSAISRALDAVEPAEVRYAHRGLSVAAVEGERCIASLSADGNLGFSGCWKDGTEITGAIRAAFQMVEPTRGLLRRGDTVRAFPVQAIGLGKVVTILALSGEAMVPAGVSPRGLIFAPFSNEATAPPKDERVSAAVQKVLSRAR
jgi:hypothetical protein